MSVSPSSSVQQARQALADRLRELRVQAELTAIQLAERTGWDRTKVSKLEHAVRPPSVADIRAWCQACGAQDHADDLVAALRAAAGMYVEWRRLQRTGLRRLQDQRTAVFEETRQFRIYSSLVVPGMLQTAEYARAVMAAVVRQNQVPDDLDEAVAARMRRARLLRSGGRRFAFVLEEAVLHYRLGDAGVMAGQLDHLQTVLGLPAVSLAVIPFTAVRTVYPLANFSLYDTAEVRIELLSAAVSVTAPGEIAQYRREFELLAALAVTGREARELIEVAAATL